MEKKFINVFKNSVWGLATILGCSACTDTIDDHYTVSDGVATKSLWEQIVAQPNLTQFAKVLENVHFYSTETKASSLTYKDILQNNNKMTVWAPVDGSFDVEAVMRDIQKDEYGVDKRFVRNYINTFSKNVSGSEKDSIIMLNAKMNVVDNLAKTFKGIEIVESNIPATNGVLHKLDSAITFMNNLYEYMQITPEVSKLYQYFHERDSIIFDENQSVPGGFEDGELTWADSVTYPISKVFLPTYSHNGMKGLRGVGEFLNKEDSSFVMVMPTNIGWEKAVAKMFPKYKYMTLPYANKNDKYKEPVTVNADTMQKYMAEEAIVRRLVFCPGQQKDYTLEDFGHTDSLFTSTMEVIDTPYCNNIFKGIDPVVLSNGYAYLSDNYRYNTVEDIELEGENLQYLYKDGINISTDTRTATVTKENRNKRIKGSISNNGYIYTATRSVASATNLAFMLPSVLSTKYDIYAIMLPENIRDSSNYEPLQLKFSATINYDDGVSPDGIKKDSEIFINDTSKVDTILLFKDFEFPIAYKNVDGAYPILTLRVRALPMELRNGVYSNSICVDKIILRAKEED